MKHLTPCLLLAFVPLNAQLSDAPNAEPGFTRLFNGHDLNGWKAGDNPDSWSIHDGAIVAHGTHSHLFYVGEFKAHMFQNFELKVDVLTKPGANGGVYIQTELQPGWPGRGFEIQVNNTYTSDPRKTFSIYEVKDVHEQLVPDNQWFTEDIIARDNTITVKYNGKIISAWTQPEDWAGTSDFAGRRIGAGTVALQAHDPGSEVWYRNIRIKPI